MISTSATNSNNIHTSIINSILKNYSILLVCSFLLFNFFPFDFIAAQHNHDHAGHHHPLPFSLYDAEWEFRSLNEKLARSREWKPATVPGSVFNDLLENEAIPDPFLYQNEAQVQWVEEQDWSYRTQFALPHYSTADEFLFAFEGLDTYAKVYLNDSLILESENMFLSHLLILSRGAFQDTNELRIDFESVMKRGRPLMNALSYELPASNDQGKDKVSPFVRKAPFQFGWDWAPRLVGAGIYKPVHLVPIESKLMPLGLRCFQHKFNYDSSTAVFESEIYIAEAGEYRLDYSGDCQEKERTIFLEKGLVNLTDTLTFLNPKLWWPNGYGEQNLMRASLVLYDSDGEFVFGTSDDVGFRKLELIREPDEIGTSYYFRINDQPVFCKGANMIPPDAMLGHEKSMVMNMKLLEAAVDANMNMIRVWGGGVYPDEFFYQECDRLGLMVWQDFMFACGMYPGDQDFQKNVQKEVEQAVRTAAGHPSVVQFCGNNEVQVAWNNWGWQKQFGYSSADSTAIIESNLQLFEELIPEWTQFEKYGIPYVATSPLSNWGTADNFNHHSMHYWGVWHGEEPFTGFQKNVGRFMSEYGHQSMPNWESMKLIAPEGERTLDAPAVISRQKSYKGNRLLTEHMNRHFKKAKDFKSFTYLSQLTQAKGIRMAIDAHRSAMPHCMGSLYWQLNDCFPAISWSSIDYKGTWKALHYEVREAFKPVSIVVDTLGRVLLINEQHQDMQVEFFLRHENLKGKECQSVENRQKVDAFSVSELYKLSDLKRSNLTHKDRIFVSVSVGDSLIDTHVFYPVAPKEMSLKNPKIQYIIKEENGAFVLSLTSTSFAKDVFLNARGEVYFEDNYFDLMPGETKTLRFSTYMPLEILEEVLEIQSVYDSFK